MLNTQRFLEEEVSREGMDAMKALLFTSHLALSFLHLPSLCTLRGRLSNTEVDISVSLSSVSSFYKYTGLMEGALTYFLLARRFVSLDFRLDLLTCRWVASEVELDKMAPAGAC